MSAEIIRIDFGNGLCTKELLLDLYADKDFKGFVFCAKDKNNNLHIGWTDDLTDIEAAGMASLIHADAVDRARGI